jgi:hypothetical protein
MRLDELYNFAIHHIALETGFSGKFQSKLKKVEISVFPVILPVIPVFPV